MFVETRMSRLLLLILLYFAVPDTSRVSGKVYHIRRRPAEYSSPTRIALPDHVSMETDDLIGSYGFGDGSRRRFKRAVSDRLVVNMTILPDEGHNEAIVHWSGKPSSVRS